MKIVTLDIATCTGYAIGEPPADLRCLNSGSFTVRVGKAHPDIVKDHVQLGLNMTAWLVRNLFTFADQRPDLVVYEAPMSPQVKQKTPRSDASILLPWKLADVVETECFIRNVRCERVYPNTFRAVFLGSTGAGNRSVTKQQMIQRCIDYGYMQPRDRKDDNRADAIGLWHWAQIHFARWQPPVEFVMGRKLEVVR